MSSGLIQSIHPSDQRQWCQSSGGCPLCNSVMLAAAKTQWPSARIREHNKRHDLSFSLYLLFVFEGQTGEFLSFSLSLANHFELYFVVHRRGFCYCYCHCFCLAGSLRYCLLNTHKFMSQHQNTMALFRPIFWNGELGKFVYNVVCLFVCLQYESSIFMNEKKIWFASISSFSSINNGE